MNVEMNCRVVGACLIYQYIKIPRTTQTLSIPTSLSINLKGSDTIQGKEIGRENVPKAFLSLPDIDPPSLPKIPLKQKEKKDQIEHGSSFLHLFCFFLNLLLISGVQI